MWPSRVVKRGKAVLWAGIIAPIVWLALQWLSLWLSVASGVATTFCYLRRVRRSRLEKARMRLSAARTKWQSAVEDATLTRELQALGVRSGGQWVSLSNGKTHYVFRDEGTGPVVLLFHGFAMFSVIWENTMNTLAEAGYRPLALDFYGFGFSEAPEGVAFNGHELLSSLGIREVMLVGHSMGGLLSAVFAVRYPDLVRKLVLIAPAGTKVGNPFGTFLPMSFIHSGVVLGTLPGIGPSLLRLGIWILQHQTTARLALSKKRSLSISSLQEAAPRLNRNAGESRRGVASRFANMIDLITKGVVFQDTHNERFTSILSEVLCNMDMFGDWRDVYAAVGRNSHPTLVVWGDTDEFIPVANASKYLRPAIPSGQFETLQDADHFVFLNCPEEFNKIFLYFLGRTITSK